VSTDQKEYLGDILMSSRHLLQLINDVLDLAKVESGKMEFHREVVDLSRVFGEVSDILRTLISEKRIQVDWLVDSALGMVLVDSSKLKQVLYNYVSNAIKFTPDEGRVLVRARSEDDQRFRLEVEDSGIGIREDDFERLFVEFQQLDASISKKYQGTGLGLALTRRIVEAQGGKVGVSSAPGRGSVFYAVLPKVSGDGPSLVPDWEAPPHTGGGPRVLVVEDNAKERAWLACTLEGAGYAVETVETGMAAIERARHTPFDAVTLDLLLPDMTGLEVLKEIRRSGLNPDVPVVVASVVADKGIGACVSIHDFLTKPVHSADLLRSLRRLDLSGAAPRRLLVLDDASPLSEHAGSLRDELGIYLSSLNLDSGARLASEAQPPLAIVVNVAEDHSVDLLREVRAQHANESVALILETEWPITSSVPHLKALAERLREDVGAATPLLAELERLLTKTNRSEKRDASSASPRAGATNGEFGSSGGRRDTN
jgi:CheY-like chemotaxis protein/two-component sensor histidine kinase